MTFKVMVLSGALWMAASACSSEQAQSWSGEIGDQMCAGNHASMGGTSARECTEECVKSMGSKYTLWVDKNVYELSDQTASAAFAGQKVKVTGKLDAATKVIQVQKIESQ
jgi:hypothetical protein